jgi:hypothetical protein
VSMTATSAVVSAAFSAVLHLLFLVLFHKFPQCNFLALSHHLVDF